MEQRKDTNKVKKKGGVKSKTKKECEIKETKRRRKM
jgi:hypothetical protein